MARQYQPARRKPGISSITYWRKFAQHRLIYLFIAGVFAFGMMAYFGGSGPMGAPNTREERQADVIATVNGEPITRGEFDSQWAQMKRFFGGNDVNSAQFQGNTLGGLINNALQISLAKKKGLSVSDADIDKALAEQKKDRSGKPVPEADWQKMLEMQGVTERDLRDSMQTGLLPTVLQDSFKNQIKVTDEELKATFDEVKARKIVISGPEAQSKTKLQKILAELKKGADFAALANKHSDDPANKSPITDPKTKKTTFGPPKGGDMGWVPLTTGGMVQPAEVDALKKLKPGEVSDVIVTPAGSEIIKVEQTRRNLPPDFDKNKAKLMDEYKSKQAGEVFRKYLEEENKKATIVWKDPSFKWRYDYGQANNPMGGGLTGDSVKKQAEMKQQLRDYTAKHKEDAAAALVLAKMVEQEMFMTRGPRHDEARAELIKLYEQGLVHSEDSTSRMRLATLYLEAGKPQDALRHYEKEQRLLSWDDTPGSKFTHQQLEAAFKKLGKPDLAAKEAKKIAKLIAEEKKADEERRKQEAERKKAEAEAKKKAAANPVKPGAPLPTKDAVVAPGGTISIAPGPGGTISGPAAPGGTISGPAAPVKQPAKNK